MELCKGDLHYFLRRRYTVDLVPLTSTEIWEVFRQIVAGIGYIHSLGMMHRDIKPKNSTLCRNQAYFSSLYHRREFQSRLENYRLWILNNESFSPSQNPFIRSDDTKLFRPRTPYILSL
jgi:serine/threonine protein kinase